MNARWSKIHADLLVRIPATGEIASYDVYIDYDALIDMARRAVTRKGQQTRYGALLVRVTRK